MDRKTGDSQSLRFSCFPFLIEIVIEIQKHIRSVYDTVHDGSHDEGGGHIEYGVLFDQHG